MVSITIPEEKTERCLKGLKKAAPHAVVHTKFLCISNGKVLGVALHPGACGYEEAPLEMDEAEFTQLQFELINKTG